MAQQLGFSFSADSAEVDVVLPAPGLAEASVANPIMPGPGMEAAHPAGYPETIQAVVKLYRRLYDQAPSWTIFPDSLKVFLAALRSPTDGEGPYFEAIKPFLDGGQNPALDIVSAIFGHLIGWHVAGEQYADVLGSVYMELGHSGAKSLGQFFTPWNVAYMMARMMAPDNEPPSEFVRREGRRLSICDPACGSGIMLLAVRAAVADRWGRDEVRHLALFGQDLDPICVAMARINLTLTDDRYMRDWLIIKMHEIREQAQAA